MDITWGHRPQQSVDPAQISLRASTLSQRPAVSTYLKPAWIQADKHSKPSFWRGTALESHSPLAVLRMSLAKRQNRDRQPIASPSTVLLNCAAAGLDLNECYDMLAEGATGALTTSLQRPSDDLAASRYPLTKDRQSTDMSVSPSVSASTMLLSIEGESRMRRAATTLYCVAAAQSADSHPGDVSLPYRNGKGQVQVGASDVRNDYTSELVQRHFSRLCCGRTAAVISRQLKRDGHWAVACRVLQPALEGSSTGSYLPHTLAAGVEVFAAAKKWEAALRLMQLLPRSEWQETDVCNVLKAISSSGSRSAWVGALEVASEAFTVRPNNQMAVSGPMILNHVLGILGRNNNLELCTSIVRKYLLPTSTDAVSGAPIVRGNSVTITQMCFAFRSHWNKALEYASALIASSTNEHGVCSVDALALGRLSSLCAANNKWEEGMRVIELSERSNVPLEGTAYADLVKALVKASKNVHARYIVEDVVPARCNPKVHAKVLNAMIQNSTTLEAMKPYLSTCIEKKYYLESETHLSMCQAYAHEGMWESSLRSMTALHQRGTVSSPAHDAVQFAILQVCSASKQQQQDVSTLSVSTIMQPTIAPPPSWRLAVSIFAQMTQVEGATISEVAFRSCVRTCFAQGATEAAQNILKQTIRFGVGRR